MKLAVKVSQVYTRDTRPRRLQLLAHVQVTGRLQKDARRHATSTRGARGRHALDYISSLPDDASDDVIVEVASDGSSQLVEVGSEICNDVGVRADTDVASLLEVAHDDPHDRAQWHALAIDIAGNLFDVVDDAINDKRNVAVAFQGPSEICACEFDRRAGTVQGGATQAAEDQHVGQLWV